jgi:predicted kinase
MIIVMAGLPGTGKTTLACKLASSTAGCVVSKDTIRAALFFPNDIEYSTAQDDFCMDVMLETAQYLLRKNSTRKIFLDGRTFSRRCQIERVLSFAKELNQPWAILECVCPEVTAQRRLDVDQDSSHPARNRSFALYQEVKSRFEPIDLPKTVISTDDPLDVCVLKALAVLG